GKSHRAYSALRQEHRAQTGGQGGGSCSRQLAIRFTGQRIFDYGAKGRRFGRGSDAGDQDARASAALAGFRARAAHPRTGPPEDRGAVIGKADSRWSGHLGAAPMAGGSARSPGGERPARAARGLLAKPGALDDAGLGAVRRSADRIDGAARRMNARAAAIEILARVEKSDAFLNIALDSYLRRHRPGDPRDAALITELCYGTMRRRMALDHAITAQSKKR